MYKIIFLFLTVLSINAFAHSDPHSFDALSKELVSLSFNTPDYKKNQTHLILKHHLVELNALLKDLSDYDMVRLHLIQTQHALQSKNYALARTRLKLIPWLLSGAYYNEVPQRFTLNVTRSDFNSDFDFAEFSYISNNYQDAITYYDKYLTTHHLKTKKNIQIALERLLTIYMQIDQDPSLAAHYIHEYINYLHAPDLKLLIKKWMCDLSETEQELKDFFHTNTPLNLTKLQPHLDLYLNDANIEPNKIKNIIFKGLLINAFNQENNEQEKPMLLYYIALCDQKLNDSLYQETAAHLLQVCFLKYPKHHYAQLAKQAYLKIKY